LQQLRSTYKQLLINGNQKTPAPCFLWEELGSLMNKINLSGSHIMKPFLSFLLFLALFGCTTYYIPIESFKNQFNGIDSTKLRMVEINVPVYINGVTSNTYPANPIDTIDCVDENNKSFKLANGPSIEIRFTDKNDDRTIFYFDTIYLQDSLIVGAKSRLVPTIRDAIPLIDVKLIEVQDGKKDFHYIKNDE
jgi:hypothetical protein